jgi:hypothetical protein
MGVKSISTNPLTLSHHSLLPLNHNFIMSLLETIRLINHSYHSLLPLNHNFIMSLLETVGLINHYGINHSYHGLLSVDHDIIVGLLETILLNGQDTFLEEVFQDSSTVSTSNENHLCEFESD